MYEYYLNDIFFFWYANAFYHFSCNNLAASISSQVDHKLEQRCTFVTAGCALRICNNSDMIEIRMEFPRGGGGLGLNHAVCVCPKIKETGSFLVSSE